MNRLLSLHPSFDALSAHSDRLDLSAPRSRVGRHIDSCGECRGTLEEIRALGDAAREMATAEAPADLWERIARSAASRSSSETASAPPPALADVAPKQASSRAGGWAQERPSTGAWVGAIVAVAAALTALVAWPGGRSLQAVGVSRLTFSPSRPVPGGVLTVRYRPAGTMKGATRLVLVGEWVAPRVIGAYYRFPALMDSMAPFRLAADGMYEAQVRLPSDFLGASLAVSDDAGHGDMDGYRPWQVVGGAKDGRPSLASLLASIGSYRQVSGLGASREPRQSFEPADSLKRHFPSHPAGWAYSRPAAGRGSLVDRLIGYFQSSEKRYLALNDALWPRTDLDAERLHDMAVFAFAIEEPREAGRWVRRLVREHPEDPRALGDLLASLHAVELTQPPSLADSIRPWLPLLDSLYAHTGRPSEDAHAALNLARRYADSSTIALWERRVERTSRFLYWYPQFDTDETARRAAGAGWAQATASTCQVPPGKFSVRGLGGDWVSACQREQTFAFTFRAKSALLDGNAAAARSLADSAITAAFGWQSCASYYGAYVTRARASLDLGDTLGSTRDLITYASIGPAARPASDSARRWLGPRFDDAKFTAAADSARTVYRACVDTKKKAEARKRQEEQAQAHQ
jgi:hypothetical protein